MSLILVPTDLQPPSRAAFHAAARAARAFDAKVALLHVVPRPEIPAPPGVGLLGAEVMAVWDGLEVDGPQAERLEEMVEAFVREDPSMPRPDLCLLRAGPPAETIVQTAEALDALMIAIATHGRTGVAHFLLGSTAEEVVRRAPCAVLSVKPGDVLALAGPSASDDG